jgi:glyoxylase-like metal-dependent hydrolase (beta-lactamase superfamily II)
VRAIINSHWHLDHIGGNLMLREAYPDTHVYASSALRGALTGFLARYRAQLVELAAQSNDDPAAQESTRAEIALIDAGSALEPNIIVQASGLRTIAGYDLDLQYERAAVTAGDVWVFDPETRILLAGDLVTLPAPFLDTACPRRWSAALRHLTQTRFRVLVPGHGAPMDRAGLGIYREAFDGLLSCAESEVPKGECIEGWLRDADALVPESDREYARGALDYYLDQVLRGHDDRIEAACAV